MHGGNMAMRRKLNHLHSYPPRARQRGNKRRRHQRHHVAVGSNINERKPASARNVWQWRMSSGHLDNGGIGK